MYRKLLMYLVNQKT